MYIPTRRSGRMLKLQAQDRKNLTIYFTEIMKWTLHSSNRRGRHGCNHMVVGFTTTYAISAYQHWCCEFESLWLCLTHLLTWSTQCLHVSAIEIFLFAFHKRNFNLSNIRVYRTREKCLWWMEKRDFVERCRGQHRQWSCSPDCSGQHRQWSCNPDGEDKLISMKW
jgi:hypothetical protein